MKWKDHDIDRIFTTGCAEHYILTTSGAASDENLVISLKF